MDTNNSNTHSAYTAQNKYSKSQKAAGLVKVTVWVPTTLRQELIQHASELREGQG